MIINHKQIVYNNQSRKLIDDNKSLYLALVPGFENVFDSLKSPTLNSWFGM